MSIRPDQFLEYLQRRAGETLRAVMLFTESNYKHLYLRDDLEESYSEQHHPKIAKRMRRETDCTYGTESELQVGELDSITLVFDEAIVLIFPATKTRGAAVSLDRGAGSQLFEFVHEARRRLYGRSH
jgi:hypothetical protein